MVSDYGAFRDLQRHRMLTIEWQHLGPGLGYEMPETVVEAGLAERYERSMARSADLYQAMASACPAQASYAVALAFRIRYAMQMNAREAMHMLELRSGEQGHPAYRVVAQDMHRLIAEHAGHRLIAEAMGFVDHASIRPRAPRFRDDAPRPAARRSARPDTCRFRAPGHGSRSRKAASS